MAGSDQRPDCWSATASTSLTVLPTSTTSCSGVSASVVAPASLTAGQALSLSATVSPTSASAVYAWTGPSGFTSTAAAPTIPATTTANSGTYSLTVALPNGCTATASTSLTVLPTSTTSCSGVSASVVAPTSLTAGQALSLSATVSPTSASAVYAWTGPSGFTSTAAAPTIPATTTANSGTYSLTVSLPNGCTATASTSLTVLPTSTTSCSGVSASVVAPASLTAGQALSLSATVSPTSASAVYAWTGPDTFTSTVAAPTIPVTTTANTGTYSLTVALPGGCTTTAGTLVTVVISPVESATDCNVRIIANDASGTETDLIPRSTTATGGVGSLTLTVEHLDGLSLAGYTYQWSRQTGSATPLPVGTSPTLSATAIGQYQVVLTSPQGSTCVAYTTLRSKPCRQVTHTYQCGTAPAAPLPDNGSRLSNLAPGDTIRTGDFDVIVMTVSGGSSGWTGTGYTEIPYLKNTRLAVELKGAIVNDCYELVGGTIVSAYDPNWGGLQDADNGIKQVQETVRTLLETFDSYKSRSSEIEGLIKSPQINSDTLRAKAALAKNDIVAFIDNVPGLTDNERTALKAEYDELNNTLLAASPGSNAYAEYLNRKQAFDQRLEDLKATVYDVFDIINLIVKYTERDEALRYTKNNYWGMFSAGLVHEIFSTVDAKSISKALLDFIVQRVKKDYNYFRDCGIFGVTGDLDRVNECFERFIYESPVFEIAGITIKQLSEFAGLVYDNDAYARGELTGFILTCLASSAKEVRMAASAVAERRLSGTLFSRTAVREAIDKLKNTAKEGWQKIADELAAKAGIKRLVRGMSFDDFFNRSTYINLDIAKQAYDLWSLKKWSELEQLFTKNNLNGGWPPCDGFADLTKGYAEVGEILDRYDFNGKRSGTFVSPLENGSPYSFDKRALRGVASDYKEYYKVRVLRRFEVEKGSITPWFGKPGYGKQYKLPKSVGELSSGSNPWIEVFDVRKP
ncbi:TNT domain-containing protein [Spirosoma sordidisoli]|uniref:DUF4237 domain-containing protein n=1 Tax=Spirosoma sordidisoli TaxID=2502893 RepID=A0A4Q2UGF8_9BACT|nr:TNT domain-containing protein [Spirosoma sordidisoli]RYC68214.1 DUF4237 domain-containing protein [Spirosoma sordidisoli]